MFASLAVFGVLLILVPGPAFQEELLGLAAIKKTPQGAQCYESIQTHITSCMDTARSGNQFKNIAPDDLQKEKLDQLKKSGCKERKVAIECINDASCKNCNYTQAKAFAIWYKDQDRELESDCKLNAKPECQSGMSTPYGPPNDGGTSSTTEKSKTAMIIIIVVVVVLAIAAVIVVYCYCCKKNDPEIAKGPTQSGPKSKNPAKSSKAAEGSNKSKPPGSSAAGKSSVGGKSAVKSSVSAGGKSKVNSSVSAAKSSAKSSAAPSKAGSSKA